MSRRIVARYRIATPLFGGGADRDQQPTFRATAWKGLLRFWWRAWVWPRIRNIEAILKWEQDLFGSASGGASRVPLAVSAVDQPRAAAGIPLQGGQGGGDPGAGIRYLGFGLLASSPQPRRNQPRIRFQRRCLLPGTVFEVRMRLRPSAGAASPEEDLESLQAAMVLLGTLGGLGSRSRRGWGSLELLSLECDGRSMWSPPSTAEELADQIRRHLPDLQGPVHPPWTAFGPRSRILLLETQSTEPLAALERIGRELIRYRSYGQNGRILGNQPSERNFQDDHDLMKANPSKRKHHPRRIAFGLPHNYRGPDGMVKPNDFDRRASPLFLHGHQLEGRACVVLTFLPAVFLPRDRNRIRVGGAEVHLANERELYRPVEEFLDRLLDPEIRVERFDAASVVLS